MSKAIIEYKKPETLKMLKGLAKYLDFKVVSDKTNADMSLDDILIPGDKALDVSALENIFTGSGIDAKILREKSWKRSK